ncbi:hypothetical protein [Sutcliffiella horikoshii]|uniref:hypothetical protein n=1 Tax=Sutcliffiella horikoshii TaxID=79883 RepID=UPI001F4153E7|nr:hypothetical protein [Sutcliffiella horikoshii]
MPCIRNDLAQPVCLTLIYNVFSGAIISSNVECNECALETDFDFETKNLTIRVPLITEGILTINDNFQASCVTKNITLPSSQSTQQNSLLKNKNKNELESRASTPKLFR